MMLTEIKLCMGITHSRLDDAITGDIETARAELVRAGVLSTKANDGTDSLINKAIKTYCYSQWADTEKAQEGYMESFKYQLENLRKSTGYKAGDTVV